MTKRDIGKEIIEGLEEIKSWKRGEKRLRVIGVDLQRAAEVAAIRRRLGLSQDQFAGLMGVSVATLRNWEQGRREPHGPARSLLLIASREPVALLKALSPGTGTNTGDSRAARGEKAAEPARTYAARGRKPPGDRPRVSPRRKPARHA